MPFATVLGPSTTGNFTLTSVANGTPGVDNWTFYGFEDTDGITSIEFSAETNNNWYYGIYDFIYEDLQAVSAEPTTWSDVKALFE